MSQGLPRQAYSGCAAIIAFALALVGLSEPSHSDSLEDALVSAYQSNPTLLAAR